MVHRKAECSDIVTIANLKFRMFKEVGMEHLLMDGFLNEVEQTYHLLYSERKAQHFVIEDNNQIIACAGAFIKDDIPYCFYKDRKYGFIGDVYVEPSYRKRGYARSLTNAVIGWLGEQDIKVIRLLASHNARNLYESLGFKGTDEMVLRLTK